MIKGTRIAALVTAVLGMACLWDSDTLHDEMQTEADTFDLITGQFPHHGKVYYEARITRTLARLEGNPDHPNLRNDLASGYLRVERFEDALREFEALRKEKPGEYKTLSNLGVLHKKMGNYARAFEYTAQALEIKPEGHLGLGDWYLKMLRYRRDAAVEGASPPAKNFLGNGYDDYSKRELNEEDFKKLQLLIRADRTFPDALLVMGDHLSWNFHLNLALWAYVRARDLGHPNPNLVDRRIRSIHQHWNNAVSSEGKSVESLPEITRGVREDLKKTAMWLETFQEVEATLVSSGEPVDIKKVEKEMMAMGIVRFRPANRGVLPFGDRPEPPLPVARPAETQALDHPLQARSELHPLIIPACVVLGLLLPGLVGFWSFRRSHRRVRRTRRIRRSRPALGNAS